MFPEVLEILLIGAPTKTLIILIELGGVDFLTLNFDVILKKYFDLFNNKNRWKNCYYYSRKYMRVTPLY